MSADERMVIVGAGQAGLHIAEALRSLGYEGGIELLGEEFHPPYHRPPLSKSWLAGEMDATQLIMRAPDALLRKRISLRTGTKVRSIDRLHKQVCLVDGNTISYTGLALATGSSPRILSLPGVNSKSVLALRTLDDASSVAKALALCAKKRLPVVVIGGGFIGLEVAATARKYGLDVTVLEAAPRLLSRVLAPVLSDWYVALHESRGVQLVLGAQVVSIESNSDGYVRGVCLADGSSIEAGLVLSGIGVSANDQLAKEAGITCEGGILVDSCSRTNDPHIVAAGDCTARKWANGRIVRLESVQNATEQAKSAASALLGNERPFDATPWFWSDQYDKKLQMAGISLGADEWAVRGEMNANTSEAGFSVFHFSQGTLLAVDSVNAGKDHLLARKLLDSRVSPTVKQVTDLSFNLADLLR